MTRYKASTIHLAISASVVSVVMAVVFLLWYPGPTFEISGARIPVFVLIGVDLVLGPLLTLIVYKEGKRGLKFDLSFIASVQLVALWYGAGTLHAERPAYLVFAVDRISLVSHKTVDRSLIRYAELRHKPVGDLLNVFARVPVDADEFQTFSNSVLFEGMPDLNRRTEFWEPWDAGSDIIRDAIIPLQSFETDSEIERQEISDAIARHEDTRLGFLPIGGIDDDIGLLMDMDSLAPLGVIRVDPW